MYAADALQAPASLFGKYEALHKVCFPGPNGDWDECGQGIDVITISRNESEFPFLETVYVTAELIFANGHTCSFEGNGVWNNVDRVLVTNGETGCEFVLVYSPPYIHSVVKREKQCRSHCGMRGTLDQAVLRKSE